MNQKSEIQPKVLNPLNIVLYAAALIFYGLF